MPLIDKPKQELALSYYKDPASETFGNLYRSCIKAGFSDSYSKNITSKRPEWLSENTARDVEMIQVAEANMHYYANLKKNGINTKIDAERAKIQQDASKFILKTLARKKYKEDAGDDIPSQVQINIINYAKTQGVDVVDIQPARGTDDTAQVTGT